MNQRTELFNDVAKHHLADVGSTVDLTALAPGKGNYEKIDNVIQAERDLRNEVSCECSKFRKEKIRKIIISTLILLASWSIAIPLVSVIVYHLFDADSVFMPIIISFVIVSPVILLIMSLVTANHCNKISKFKIDKEKELERKTTAMYANLLCGKEIHDFLDIPQHYDFDKEGLPFVKYLDDYFIRYIAPHSGTKYHKEKGCCKATFPVHIYTLSGDYSPCSKCNRDEQESASPEWHEYYMKVRRIVEKYGFEIKNDVHF